MNIDDVITLLQAANKGIEIQRRLGNIWVDSGYHITARESIKPLLAELVTGSDFRVKPIITVKKKGWVNVYDVINGMRATGVSVFNTEEEARQYTQVYSWKYLATVPIEWEEAV